MFGRSGAMKIIVVVVIAAIASPAFADCGSSVNRYNNILNDANYALRRYAQCVGDSRGKEDCSSEFSRIRSFQSDFESAVSDLKMSCDKLD